MFPTFRLRTLSAALIVCAVSAADAVAQPKPARPWVYESGDTSKERTPRRRATGAEIGTLTMMTAVSRNAVLSRISGDRVYDLHVQYFIGLPSWYGVDDLPPIVARAVLIDVAGLKAWPSLRTTIGSPARISKRPCPRSASR